MNIFNKTTYESLKKNKTRTIVTIIGVILSAAMITAVAILVSSFQNFLLRMEIEDNGDWQAKIEDCNYSGYQELSCDSKLSEVGSIANLGYSEFPEGIVEGKPYIYLKAYDSAAMDMTKLTVSEGRLPKNSEEIILSNRINRVDGVKYKIGDKVTLTLGKRMSDGYELKTYNLYLNDAEEGKEDSDGETEVFVSDNKEQTYTVVGFSEYNFDEMNSQAAYLAYTYCNKVTLKNCNNLILCVKAENIKKIKNIIEPYCNDKVQYEAEYNYELLRYYGMSDNDNYTTTFAALEAILIGLIMIGAVALIYNAFSISVSERKKQFGLLSSIGATKTQIAKSVLFEAVYISVIGVPIGIVAGIGGIAVTLKFVSNVLETFSFEYTEKLRVYITPATIITAALIGFLVVLISSYIPSIRASKTSVIDAIRQTNDIKLTSKQVKTSKLTKRLFGLEGELASKNFKRNKKKYRTTVISLFISIVLFVSATSFCNYLMATSTNVIVNTQFDLVCGNHYQNYSYEKTVSDYNRLKSADGIKESSLLFRMSANAEVTKEVMNERYYNNEIEKAEIDDGVALYIDVCKLYMQDEEFKKTAKELGLDAKNYMDTDNPRAIAYDMIHSYNKKTERYENVRMFKADTAKMQLSDYVYDDSDYSVTDTEAAKKEISIDIVSIDKVPLGVDEYVGYQIILLMPYSIAHSTFSGNEEQFADEISSSIFITCDKPENTLESIKGVMPNDWNGTIHNKAADEEENRKLIMLINLFSYGFIVLISLITVANVFNTISTNITLRKREFAMLKSVGMTNGGFNKMMNYECLLYGTKALIFGLPVSVIITYFIYDAIMTSVDMKFILPYKGMLISTISVFLVVFITMIYSMSKIKKQNIIETLKNDNI